MNICHVITRLIVGGAQENTVLTCRGLTERGHDVTLIAGPETGPEGSLWAEAASTGCRLVRLNSLRRGVNPWHDWRARCELIRLFTQCRPAVVHTHSSKAGILGRFAAAAARVPLVVHTIHGMSFNRTQPFPVYWLYRALERRAARATTEFISVADSMTEQSLAAGVGSPERFTTVRSGMQVERYHPDETLRASARTRWGLGESAVAVGTVARLFENKGYEEIIAAMPKVVAQAPNARFVWIGDGARRGAYEAQLQGMGQRDRVHIVGLVQPQEVTTLLPGLDLIVHASRWEGLPRAVVQALLTEVPAVSFDNDGAPEVVIHGETGLLVPYGDVEGLAQAVVRLACDEPLRKRMGRAGRARCLAPFDWNTMVAQIEALYVRYSA